MVHYIREAMVIIWGAFTVVTSVFLGTGSRENLYGEDVISIVAIFSAAAVLATVAVWYNARFMLLANPENVEKQNATTLIVSKNSCT